MHSQRWSDEKWKSTMQKEEETRKDFSIVPILQEKFFTSEILQGHSGRNLIDPSLQDNVLIPEDLFEYICHVGCAISLHSIINSGLMPGGQNLSKKQTVFFLLVNPVDKEHKDPETVDLKAPCVAQYMQTAWKKQKNTVYWVGVRFAQKKGLKVLSDAIDDVVVLTLCDSPFHFLLSLFSPIVLFILQVFSFFHDGAGQVPCALSADEDLGTLAEYDPLTGYESNDFHISETTEPYIQESTGENGSLNSHDL